MCLVIRNIMPEIMVKALKTITDEIRSWMKDKSPEAMIGSDEGSNRNMTHREYATKYVQNHNARVCDVMCLYVMLWERLVTILRGLALALQGVDRDLDAY
ncbi:hypothetical protein L1987_42599 [Smallanthus sonchifolius]|uniref:Uncharacterized protein n=1 Tax=Smallanthus sonchifolius TaxID=185202 RepID=A0ACB9GKG2_9ASTR|nr:hypothetical protein L1987_42599 [Smallanthus sonchifolius]